MSLFHDDADAVHWEGALGLDFGCLGWKQESEQRKKKRQNLVGHVRGMCVLDVLCGTCYRHHY